MQHAQIAAHSFDYKYCSQYFIRPRATVFHWLNNYWLVATNSKATMFVVRNVKERTVNVKTVFAKSILNF